MEAVEAKIFVEENSNCPLAMAGQSLQCNAPSRLELFFGIPPIPHKALEYFFPLPQMPENS